MDESQNYHANWKKPDTKTIHCIILFIWNSIKGKLCSDWSRLKSQKVVGKDWLQSHNRFFSDGGMFLSHDYSSDYFSKAVRKRKKEKEKQVRDLFFGHLIFAKLFVPQVHPLTVTWHSLLTLALAFPVQCLPALSCSRRLFPMNEYNWKTAA